MATQLLNRPATLADLMGVEGKAELIGGRIVRSMATGYLPSRVAKNIFRSLDAHAVKSKVGEAFSDNLGYAVDPPLPSGRQTFSPDVSYLVGLPPTNRMSFVDGSPVFAIEVRSENGFTATAESEMEEKRADYFSVSTSVVWDVDPVNEVIACYSATAPDSPRIFHRGQVADAEPAVPGWRISVDDVFA